MNRIIIIAIFFSAISGFSPAICSWKNIASFDENAVCGFFWDGSHGLIGFGSNRGDPTQVQIRSTNDGGVTWTLCNCPNARGAVTSIFMKDALFGYASIYETSGTYMYSVWKTIDGGKTWFDCSNGNNARTNCVYATSKALIRTVWFDGKIGGISTNDGATFSTIFQTANGDRSNGIDFADDLNGVVTTMGPLSINYAPFYTNDGGLTWNQGDLIPESWSVHAQKGTMNFVVLGEDNVANPGKTVFVSTNGGRNWSVQFSFTQAEEFTGDIQGKDKILYVQSDTVSNSGLYRSDDFGSSWIKIGGPSNLRDTRFVVTGCQGEIVYAFDNTGGIWKTTDGGNGSLGFAPRVGTVESVIAGDTTLIPIYLDSIKSGSFISQISMTLTLNSDLLTPFALQTTGTLSSTATIDKFYWISRNSVYFLLTFSTPLQSFISSEPLINIRAVAYVTTTDSTDISLSALLFPLLPDVPLQTCSNENGKFILKNVCGDHTVSAFMRTGKILEFTAHPNPARSAIQIEIANDPGKLQYELFDELGIARKEGVVSENTFGIDLSALADGNYYLRVSQAERVVVTKRVVIVK